MVRKQNGENNEFARGKLWLANSGHKKKKQEEIDREIGARETGRVP